MQVSCIGSFKVVSRKFQESFKDVWGSFEGVSRVFQRSSKDDSKKFICWDEVSMVCLDSFKGVAKSFCTKSLLLNIPRTPVSVVVGVDGGWYQSEYSVLFLAKSEIEICSSIWNKRKSKFHCYGDIFNP